MENVIQQLKGEAGLTDEQARKSIEIMKNYIVSKVPPMFSGFVDSFFAKNSSDKDKEIDPLA
jgi:hypothetical protein